MSGSGRTPRILGELQAPASLTGLGHHVRFHGLSRVVLQVEKMPLVSIYCGRNGVL